jgi:hypothetical protein
MNIQTLKNVLFRRRAIRGLAGLVAATTILAGTAAAEKQRAFQAGNSLMCGPQTSFPRHRGKLIEPRRRIGRCGDATRASTWGRDSAGAGSSRFSS